MTSTRPRSYNRVPSEERDAVGMGSPTEDELRPLTEPDDCERSVGPPSEGEAMPSAAGSPPVMPPPPTEPAPRYEESVGGRAEAECPEGAAPLPQGADPPPAYTDAVKLPSYEEAARTKGAHPAQVRLPPLRPDYGDSEEERLSTPGPRAAGSLFLPASFFSHDLDMREFSDHSPEAELGTNLDYLCTFMVAFLFNWIGFLAASCFSMTVAGRFGALAGFGLSLVKWTLIFKHSTDFVTQEWLWWILMMLGFFMFFRGSIQYMRIKQTWSHLSTEARNRLLYYYY